MGRSYVVPVWFSSFLALAFLCFAHVPHDEVIAVAAPRELDASRPWLLLAGTGTVQMLMRSDDGGHRWHMIGGPLLEDTLLGVALLDNGTWVAASETRVWWSVDEGATWASRLAPGPIRVLGGGATMVIGGPRGGWKGRPDGLLLRLPMASVDTISGGEDGWTALDEEQHIWLSTGGAEWDDIGRYSKLATRATRVGELVYVGTREGRILHRGELGVEACGELPAEARGEHATVTGLSASPVTPDDPEGVLVVATGDAGPYLSRDGCASWQDLHGPLVTVYQGSGSASSTDASNRTLAVSGTRWAQAGWAGLVIGDATSAYEPQIIPPDYTRGIAFSPGFGDDRTVLVGGYAAGVLRSDDAGAHWLGAGAGMDAENVQRVAFPSRAEASDSVLSVTGHVGWVSKNKGRTWSSLAPPLVSVSELFGSATEQRMWAFGPTGVGNMVAVSQDGGDSWALDIPMNMALAGSTPAGVVHVQTPLGSAQVLGGGAPSRINYSFNDGATWVERYLGESDSALSGPVSWPQDNPTRVIFLDGAGVHWSDDAVNWQTWNEFDGAVPQEIEAAGSLVFVATRGGELWRSADGGESFTDLHVRFKAPVHIMRGCPHFDDEQLFLVGTHDGVYTLDDPFSDAPVAERWSPYQRIDDASSYFLCLGCGDVRDSDDAGMGGFRELGPTGVVRTTMRGRTLEIFGTLAKGASAEVWVDGSHVSDFAGDVQRHPDLLTRVDGLLDDWHDIEVRAVTDGVGIDALATSGDPVPYTSTRCGTGSASSSVAVLFASIGLLAARRRGPS